MKRLLASAVFRVLAVWVAILVVAEMVAIAWGGATGPTAIPQILPSQPMRKHTRRASHTVTTVLEFTHDGSVFTGSLTTIDKGMSVDGCQAAREIQVFLFEPGFNLDQLVVEAKTSSRNPFHFRTSDFEPIRSRTYYAVAPFTTFSDEGERRECAAAESPPITIRGGRQP